MAAAHKFYVYAVAIGGHVAYIGKGTGRRLRTHLTNSHNAELRAVIAEANAAGVPVRARAIKTNLSEAEAFQLEGRWIRAFRDRLANASIGRMSQEARHFYQLRTIRARIRAPSDSMSETTRWFNAWIVRELDGLIAEVAHAV